MKKIVLYFTAALVLIAVQSCNSNNSDNGLNNATAVDYHRLGDSLSNIAQQTLLSNVANAMQNGGPVHAIDFCNIHASGLMDSLSKVNDVQITRITDKARNSKNLAPANDMALLRKLAKEDKMDTLIATGDGYTYYKSIKIGMPTCLKCHGTPDEDIDEPTQNMLNARYPSDQATNYALGDFRGAWKIVFK